MRNTKKTLGNVNAQALFDAQCYTLAEVEAETLIEKLAKVKAEPVVDAMADTLVVVVPETQTEHW